MKLIYNSAAWRTRVRVLRVLSPVMMAFGAAAGTLAWSRGNYGFACVHAFLFGVNMVLAWIHWKIFQL